MLEALLTNKMEKEVVHKMQIAGLPHIFETDRVDRHGKKVHRFSIQVRYNGKRMRFEGPMHVFGEIGYDLINKYIDHEESSGFSRMLKIDSLMKCRDGDETHAFMCKIFRKAIIEKESFSFRSTGNGLTTKYEAWVER